MRDVRKVKNRLEVRLDSQQVFFLFAGGVTFTALVFVLGVLVGKAQRPEPGTEVAKRTTVELPTPTVQTVADKMKVETIYKLDEKDNPNSIAAALPSKTPVKKKTATTVPKRTPKPVATVTSTPRKITAASRYTVQIAAYTEPDQAFQFVEKLRSQGFEAYSVTYEPNTGPTWHRVRVGRYPTKAEADEMADRVGLRVAGVKPAVMKID